MIKKDKGKLDENQGRKAKGANVTIQCQPAAEYNNRM